MDKTTSWRTTFRMDKRDYWLQHVTAMAIDVSVLRTIVIMRGDIFQI